MVCIQSVGTCCLAILYVICDRKAVSGVQGQGMSGTQIRNMHLKIGLRANYIVVAVGLTPSTLIILLQQDI